MIYFSSRSITDLATGGHNSGGAIVNEALAAQLTGGTVESQPKKEFSDFGSLTAGEHSSQAPISRQGSWMDSDANGSGNQVATFNTAMMLIAMYWCMVLTDWGNVHRGQDCHVDEHQRELDLQPPLRVDARGPQDIP